MEPPCDTSSHTSNRKEWKEEKVVRGPRGWLQSLKPPSGDLFLDTFWGLVDSLRKGYRGADAPIPVRRVRLLPVDDDAEPLGDVHDHHQALL